MAIVFQATTDNRFYLLADEKGPLTPAVGYLITDNSPISGANRSISEAWDLAAGVFIFLNQPIADLKSFAKAARNYFTDPAREGIRFFWAINPGRLDYGLAGRFLKINYKSISQGGSQSSIKQYYSGEVGCFDFRNISLLIGKNCPINLNSATNSFEILIPADDKRRIYLLNRFGAQQLFNINSSLTLPLTGALAGCLQFNIFLNNSNLADLDIGLRIFFNDQIYKNFGFLTSQRYPIFNLENNRVNLRVNLDVIDPLNPARSFLSFIDPASGVNADSITSYYRTNLGYPINLTAQDNNSRLVFAARTLARQSNRHDPFYLVPSGDFSLTANHPQPANRESDSKEAKLDNNLICGISGIEYIKLPNGETNLIRFVTNRPAYAQQFLPSAPLPQDDEHDQLIGPATTSWAYNWQRNGTSIYYTQPEEAILFKATDDTTAGGNSSQLYDNILHFMEVPATALPAPDIKANSFPLFPYGGVATASLANFKQMEVQLLNPLRRTLIYQFCIGTENLPLTSNGNSDYQGVTPQGLMARFSANFDNLTALTLAKDTDNNELRFQNIERNSPLRTALQSNQLFMVISDPTVLKRYFTANQLTIQGWSFDLNPDSWKKQNTILIFKFFNKTLTELLDNTHYWSLPDKFNENKNGIKVKLTNLIEMVIEKGRDNATPKDREDYAQLAFAATNPNWSGIIALNVNISPSNIPVELRAISAGIDETKFYAQYLGVEVTPIIEQAGELVMNQSSLFGLIDYQNEQSPASTDSGYNFQVMKLKVLFHNSKIKAFSSEIAIVLDKLFDERTELLDSAAVRNIVILKGTAEDHGGHTTYSFSFSGINRFGLPNSVSIDEVDIIKAQFTTDPIANPTDPAAIITGRFTFWGRLNFQKLTKFDILSFGAEDPADLDNRKYLSFGNLVVTMSFAQNDRDNKRFEFNSTNLSFDLARSAVRTNSLYAHFPLKFNSFFNVNGGKKPLDLGYLSVKSPLSGSLADNWYGLTFDLELGTLGALAGSAALTVSIIAAWSPAPDGQGIFVGLRLPASLSGKTEFSLQGVIKLGFKSLEFIVGDNNGQPGYLLKLKNLSLKFLTLSIPPDAQSEIIIFGNSSGGENSAVGWYAAYAKE